MTDRRHLSEREHRMWQRVSKTIKPMGHHHQSEPSKEITEPHPTEPDVTLEIAHAPRPRVSRDDLEKLLDQDVRGPRKSAQLPAKRKEESRKAGQPADRSNEKRPRRGRVTFSGTLDLHGLTQDSARFALLEFLRFHREEGTRSVLVITGKGRNGHGVLRTRLLEWVGQPDLRLLVSGYSKANQRHGGEGAYYLFLRRPDIKRGPFGL